MTIAVIQLLSAAERALDEIPRDSRIWDELCAAIATVRRDEARWGRAAQGGPVTEDTLRARAEQLVEDLFVNGQGHRADRLMLVAGPDERDLGGWCRGAVVDRIRAAFEDVTRELRAERRACSCPVPDPVMQADGKFYCYTCSFETGARPSGLEPERFMVDLAAERSAREAAEQALGKLVAAVHEMAADEPSRHSKHVETLLAATCPPGAARWACLRCSEAAGVANDPNRHISHAMGEACPRENAIRPSGAPTP